MVLPALAAIFGITMAMAKGIAMIAASAAVVYGTVQQTRTQKKAQSTAKKLGAQQLAQEHEYAGQYVTLTKRQMELQSQQRRMETLADVITEQRSAQPTVLTLPKKAEPGILDQINSMIDRIVRG